MLKNLPFYVFVAIIVCGAFLTLLPYPTFSSGAYNLSKSDIERINRSSENECYQNLSPIDECDKIVCIDWPVADALFSSQEANMIDINSEKQINVTRIGGTYHADIVGTSPDDQQTLELLTQQQENRPILINLAPNVWTCASLSTKKQIDANGKHYCLYFKNSKAHSTGLEDIGHEKTISNASKVAQKVLKKVICDN